MIFFILLPVAIIMLVKVGAAEKAMLLQTSTSSVPWRIASLYLNIIV